MTAAKVCPREPTDSMRWAGKRALFGPDASKELAALVWRAMYDAAPSPRTDDDALVDYLRTNALGLDVLGFPETAHKMIDAADRIAALTAELAQAELVRDARGCAMDLLQADLQAATARAEQAERWGQLLTDAIAETIRRYPDSPGMAFLAAATSLVEQEKPR